MEKIGVPELAEPNRSIFARKGRRGGGRRTEPRRAKERSKRKFRYELMC